MRFFLNSKTCDALERWFSYVLRLKFFFRSFFIVYSGVFPVFFFSVLKIIAPVITIYGTADARVQRHFLDRGARGRADAAPTFIAIVYFEEGRKRDFLPPSSRRRRRRAQVRGRPRKVTTVCWCRLLYASRTRTPTPARPTSLTCDGASYSKGSQTVDGNPNCGFISERETAGCRVKL